MKNPGKVFGKGRLKVDLYLKGLGANIEFQKIYRDHIKEEI